MKDLFNKFLKNFMFGIFIFSIISSILITMALNFVVYNEFPIGLKFFINIICVFIIGVTIVHAYKKREYLIALTQKLLERKNLIIVVLLASFIIRLIWILSVDTFPVSDFESMYNAAREVSYGNFNCFHGLSYFARFTHDTMIVLYYSLFFRIYSNPIFLIKLVNVIGSIISILSIYWTVLELFGNKSAVTASILIGLFPPFIMYTSQLLSENIAMPFFLLSVYFFIRYVKCMSQYKWIILSGISLACGNMFRMVGIIFLIAYIMYLVIYKSIISSIKPIIIAVLLFTLPIYITSTMLINKGITESHLWCPKETVLTSILKGTNFNSFGFWNQEDADIVIKYNYDNEKIKEESLKIIKERLLGSPIYKVALLYIGKLAGELGFSDFNSYEFTVLDSNNSIGSNIARYFSFTFITLINLFHVFLLYFSAMYLRKSKKVKDEMNFFLILTLGFTSFYLISEVQPRYSFIICWSLVVFAVNGLKIKVYEYQDKYENIVDNNKINHKFEV